MDWTLVNTLLSVIHQASAAGPKFNAIASAATQELMSLVAEPEIKAATKAEPAKKPTTATPDTNMRRA